MVILAELHAGGIVAWLVIGVVAGWLAGKILGGNGYGVLLDLVLGLTGALVGGFVFGLLLQSDNSLVGDTGFWVSLVVAFLGACGLLAGARFLGFRQTR
jgi:uncharacterized membrane protein YeaQ/YmgE (transglycosylase-associated protein family)